MWQSVFNLKCSKILCRCVTDVAINYEKLLELYMEFRGFIWILVLNVIR